MVQITVQKPTDQPTGTLRLLDVLKVLLGSNDYNKFRFMVAFAKLSPFIKLEDSIRRWKSLGKEIEAIIGIDERGTSHQALEFCLTNFNNSYIAHVSGSFSPTFHSKIYLFSGASNAVVFIGSNNMTVGGTESNFEAFIRMDMALPNDAVLFSQVSSLWDDAKQVSRVLDNTLLSALVSNELVIDEKAMRAARNGTRQGGANRQSVEFPSIIIKPASPLPKSAFKGIDSKSVAVRSNPETVKRKHNVSIITQAHVIQLVPHHNGEVFLSVNAVKQNPDFFGYPFNGLTTPKKTSNPAYPQRVPDPVVNIRVYDGIGTLAKSHDNYNLNMVEYARNSEIRIQVPQDVVSNTPPFSILVMRKAPDGQQYDYDMDIYAPNGPDYNRFLAVCNQTLPSGGAPVARKFGWLT